MNYDIVGCGAVVERLHLPVIELLRERGEITIAGCYDLDPDRARWLASKVGAAQWGARAEPRKDDGVDAALVATPPSTHAQIAGEYIRSGKGVLVEKPFTTKGSESRQLVEAARERRVAAAVHHLYRFYPAIEIARRFLDGRLEQVRSIEASEGVRWEWSPVSSYMVEDVHGGVIHDTGSHLLDTVLYLLGLDEGSGAASVEIGELSTVPPREPSHECRARLVLNHPGKQQIDVGLTMSRLRPLPRGVRVFGSFGALFVPLFGTAPILFEDPGALRLRGAEPMDEPEDTVGCCLLAHRDFLRQLRDPLVRTRIAADRFLLQVEVLEALHRRAS